MPHRVSRARRPQSPTCRLTINVREWREEKDRRSARLVQCRLHALRRICVADQSPGCLDRKPITAALNPAGSRTGPSWLTVGRTICNAPGTHLLIASLILTNDVCVFSPRMTSVGWVKFVSMSHVMFGGGGAVKNSGAVRALSSHIVWNACARGRTRPTGVGTRPPPGAGSL